MNAIDPVLNRRVKMRKRLRKDAETNLVWAVTYELEGDDDMAKAAFLDAINCENGSLGTRADQR